MHTIFFETLSNSFTRTKKLLTQIRKHGCCAMCLKWIKTAL